SVDQAIKVFESFGAVCEEVDMPHINYANACYYIISSGEGASSLARYDGVRFGHRAEDVEGMIDMFKKSGTEGFGKEVNRRVLFGTSVLTGDLNEDYFRKAQKVRTLIANDFKDVFANYDIILGPTTASEAFKLGEQIDQQIMYMNDTLAVPANL